MAVIGSGNPKLYAEISGSQLSGSGNTRVVRITMRCRVDGNTNPSYASWFGYAANYRCFANGTYASWATLKGTESWNSTNSLRTFSQDITIDVGTSASKSITIGVQVDSLNAANDWDGSASTTMTVGATNVPPVISGTVATSPSGTIAENTGTIKITAPAASDANGNLSGYRAQVSINGGGYADIYRGSSREYSHNVSGYGEGTTFKYRFDAYDAAGAYSVDWVYSGTVTKNTFTGDTLASGSSINFNSTSISFTHSGAKNTNGNTTFTRVLSCDGVTVYNSTLGASPTTVSIWKTGALPTGCYVKFDDIKKKTINGTLSFTLRTTNAYGTSKSSSKTITVDLRTQPNPATGQVISTSTSESTMYKKVAFANNYYFLPDGNLVARVKWSAGSDKLGGAISYELYVAYGSGSYQKVADLPSGTLYYNHVIPKQTTSQQFKYMIRTKTSYGYYSDAVTPAQTLHYYNSPSITVGQINRTETAATIPVTVKSASSIPNISTVGTWSGQGSGNLTAAQTEQNISITGLTGGGTYTITVVYNDNTGFSSNQSKAIGVGANLPIMFLNKYGLGVGGAKATSANSLVVTGNALIQGPMPELKIKAVGGSVASSRLYLDRGTGASWDLYSHNGPLRIRCNYTDKAGDFYDAMTVAHKTGNVWVKGNLNAAGGLQVNGSSVYHTGNKPKPSDIDAMAATPTIVGNGTNFNNLKTPGRYMCGANNNTTNNTNMPTKVAFLMEVTNIQGIVFQNFYTYSGDLRFTRAYYDWSETWTNWNTYQSLQWNKGIIPSSWYFPATTQFAIRLQGGDFTKGAWLITMEYNHHTNGSSAYHSSEVFIAFNQTTYRNSRIEDVVGVTKVHSSGRSITPKWDSTGDIGKVYNSASNVSFVFDMPSDNHGNSGKVRRVNVRKLDTM